MLYKCFVFTGITQDRSYLSQLMRTLVIQILKKIGIFISCSVFHRARGAKSPVIAQQADWTGRVTTWQTTAELLPTADRTPSMHQVAVLIRWSVRPSWQSEARAGSLLFSPSFLSSSSPSPARIPQQVRYVQPMLDWCWGSVADGGPTLTQHWLNVLCLLGLHKWN